MCTSLCIVELHANAHATSDALNAPLQNVPNVKFTSDRFHIERSSLVGEGSVAGDDERAGNAREVGRKVLSESVDEVFLFGIAPNVREGQNDQRKARRLATLESRRCGCHRFWRLGLCRCDSAWRKPINPHGFGDILESLRPKIGELGPYAA